MTDSAPEAVIEAMAEPITPSMVTAALSAFYGERYARDYEYLEEMFGDDMRRALIAAVNAQQPRAGFVLVPVEATEKAYKALQFVFEHMADKHRGPRELYYVFGLNSTRALEMVREAIAARPGAAPTKQEE